MQITSPSSQVAVDGARRGTVGYGRHTSGGANGRIIAVRNLNDAGPGSLRAALEASGRRKVVMRVGGTIELKSSITIKNPYITVAGGSAPAPGITIKGGGIVVVTHDVILRQLRLRPGDQVDGPSDVDALTLNGNRRSVYNVVVDHLTMLWGPDIGGLAVLGDVRNVTVQYSIMGEGLYLSNHPEGTRANGGHSYAVNVAQLDAGTPAPRRITFWRNLFTTSDSRMPAVKGARCVDVVNNVIYNWGTKAANGNPRSMNLVRNWFRSGPERATRKLWHITTTAALPTAFRDSVYMRRNFADGFRGERDEGRVYARSVRCGGLSVRPTDRLTAYRAVLRGAGATSPDRDAVDRRIVANVRNRTGHFVNGTGYPSPNPTWY